MSIKETEIENNKEEDIESPLVLKIQIVDKDLFSKDLYLAIKEHLKNNFIRHNKCEVTVVFLCDNIHKDKITKLTVDYLKDIDMFKIASKLNELDYMLKNSYIFPYCFEVEIEQNDDNIDTYIAKLFNAIYTEIKKIIKIH